MGLSRFVVVGARSADARATPRRAYRCWHESFTYLSVRLGFRMKHERPPQFDAICEDRRGIAGTLEEVAEYVQAQVSASGANYFVAQPAFGDLTREETLGSIDLFAREVMPMLARHAQRASSA